jgi:hypothetical protein
MPFIQVKSHSFIIANIGECKQTTIRLPHQATKIVGIETGIRMIGTIPAPTLINDFLESFETYPSRQMGMLQLQQAGCRGIFYGCQVKDMDASIALADFSASVQFPSKIFSHGGKRLEDPIEVIKSSNIITTIYKDSGLEFYPLNTSYAVSVHVWFETQKQDKDEPLINC